jgi:hypothetical protein
MERIPARAARILLLLAALAATTAAAGSATAAPALRAGGSGALTGTWTGVLSGSANGGVRRERIRIVVNARETGGSWRVSASCYGRLTLDSISNGYHHYRRRVASRASCAGGDVDCLMRVGAHVADVITPRPGGWARNGTLHRVRSG